MTNIHFSYSDRMTAAGCLEHIWLKDECNIDRHIFTNILSNKQQLEQDDDDDEDDDDDGDDNASNADDEEVGNDNDKDAVNGVHNVDAVEDQETDAASNQQVNADNDDDEVVEDDVKLVVKDIPEAISVDNSEEEDDMLTSSSSLSNIYKKKTQSSPKATTTSATATTNGHLNYLSNGHMNGFTKCIKDSSKMPSSSFVTKLPHTSTTTKTTVVHNVPATKAITIPLSSVQQQHQQHSHHQYQQQHHHQHMSVTPTATTTTTSPHQEQQQFLHIPARRQSSESNKENTFLTTKKISASPLGIIGIKKPSTVTQSATATIVINPSVNHNSVMTPNNIVATITLPTAGSAAMACVPSPSLNVTNEMKLSASSSMITTATTNSLFPDAPTTPKVIRKAPNSDTSPTSVKALVKKFQLEGGEQPLSPPEFATNGSKPGMMLAAQLSPLTKTNETKTKYINGRTSLQNPPITHHSTAITIGNGMRRASEPITAIHHSAKKLGGMVSSSAPAPVSIPAASASNSFKSSCVYCSNTCNATKNINATNGCRHPASSSTVHKNGATSASCSTNFSQSTKSLINGSTSNGSLTSSSSNGTTTSNASSNALLFGSHQQQQQQHHLLNSHNHSHHHAHHHHHAHAHAHHHHLHHHGVVVKSAAAAANGLSLDQGIIC